MNRVVRTLLNLMRIEVLLGIGLVMWVFSLEAQAQTWICEMDDDEQWIFTKNTDDQWTEVPTKASYIEKPVSSKIGVIEDGYFMTRLYASFGNSLTYTTLFKDLSEVVKVTLAGDVTGNDNAIVAITRGECTVDTEFPVAREKSPFSK